MLKESITAIQDQDERYSNYNSYADHHFYAKKVFALITKLYPNEQFQNGLDVACADGSFASKLHKTFGIKMYGIDISSKAIEKAKKKGIISQVQNLEKRFNFPDNTFELITACEIIEHLYDTDFFLTELKRVLKDDGILILTTPNLVSLVNRFKMLFGYYPNYVPEYQIGGAGHVRAYTIPTLTKQLTKHGFKVDQIKSPNITFPMTSRIIPKIFKQLAIECGDILPKLGSHIIIVVRKVKK